MIYIERFVTAKEMQRAYEGQDGFQYVDLDCIMVSGFSIGEQMVFSSRIAGNNIAVGEIVDFRYSGRGLRPRYEVKFRIKPD